MTDLEPGSPDSTGKPSESSGMEWPRIVLIIGLLVLFFAVGLGAMLKESQGSAPKLLALAGVILMALGGLAHLVGFLKAKRTGKEATPTKS
jgi:hypothetical protein